MSMGFDNGERERARQGSTQSRPGGESGREWEAMKDDVSGIMDAATGRGRQFIDSTRDRATEYAVRRKDDMAQSVSDVASTLRDAGATFEDRPHIRAFVDSAAEGLDTFAESIRERSFGDIYDDVEEVMRRRPATVAAASLAAGFLVARFLKASAEEARAFEQRTGTTRSQARRRAAAATRT